MIKQAEGAQLKTNPSPPSKNGPVVGRELALKIAEAALDKKAARIEIIDVRGKVDYTDYVVVMSGRSDRQVAAIARGIEEGQGHVFIFFSFVAIVGRWPRRYGVVETGVFWLDYGEDRFTWYYCECCEMNKKNKEQPTQGESATTNQRTKTTNETTTSPKIGRVERNKKW